MPRLHHIGITVSDTAAATAFYLAATDGEVIGPLSKSGPAVDAATGYPGVEILLTFIRLDDGVFLELAEYRGADNPASTPTTVTPAPRIRPWSCPTSRRVSRDWRRSATNPCRRP
ncbi:hypothetical protein [Microbacterium sp. Se5.02b]|uniref:hypothetical protein n=1 Tax=Microbacterium sp. Se5.02b TaxID=2864103 RepID=UPI001C689073|nr:hypothetical protein [Microbacterium sp. Se5.02b]QYM63969.1 hypothetical protein K1X59_17930 [Microbacterium sp. Se5.02b]